MIKFGEIVFQREVQGYGPIITPPTFNTFALSTFISELFGHTFCNEAFQFDFFFFFAQAK